jgi:transcriptional regulator with PAS, ATPase and Fis domain
MFAEVKDWWGKDYMNDTETKSENGGNGNGARVDAWQTGSREIGAAEPAADLSLRSHRNEAEVHAINYALRQTGGNRKRAAKLLSISYRSLLYKIRQHNITPVASPLSAAPNS